MCRYLGFSTHWHMQQECTSCMWSGKERGWTTRDMSSSLQWTYWTDHSVTRAVLQSQEELTTMWHQILTSCPRNMTVSASYSRQQYWYYTPESVQTNSVVTNTWIYDTLKCNLIVVMQLSSWCFYVPLSLCPQPKNGRLQAELFVSDASLLQCRVVLLTIIEQYFHNQKMKKILQYLSQTILCVEIC
jgi:hypothetical protein